MRTTCFGTLFAIILSAPLTAQDPFATFTLNNPLPHIEAALRTESVQAFLDSLPVRQLNPKDTQKIAPKISAGFNLIKDWIPIKISLHTPASTGTGFTAILQTIFALNALAATMEVSESESLAARSILHNSLQDSLPELNDFAIAIRLTWGSERTAESVFENISDTVSAAIAAGEETAAAILKTHSTADKLAVSFDLETLLKDPDSLDVLKALGIVTGKLDPFLEQLREASHGVSRTLTIRQEEGHIDISMGSDDSKPQPIESKLETDCIL